MEVLEDLYEILGIAEDATGEQLRKAYIKLATELHPDRFVGRPEEQKEASARFSKVSYAHNILKDKQQRADYDFERRLKAAHTTEDVSLEPGGAYSQVEVGETKKALAEKKYNQGIALLKSDLRMAVDALKEANKLNPNVAQYHTMLGIAYQKLGWPTYALSELKSALRLAPSDFLASKWLRQVESVIREAEEREEAKKKGERGKKKDKKAKASKTSNNKFRKKKVSFWRWLLSPFVGPDK